MIINFEVCFGCESNLIKTVWHKTEMIGYHECECGEKCFFRLKEGDPLPEGKAYVRDGEYANYIKLITGI